MTPSPEGPPPGGIRGWATRALAGVGGAIVRAAILLFPPLFRHRFGAEMEAAFDEGIREASADGPLPVAAVLGRTVGDVVLSAAREWIRPTYPRAAGTTTGRGVMMDALWQDLRFAARALVRRPGFTVVAVATLALGIGANTAIFSVVNGILLRPLPYPGPDRLVMVWSHATDAPGGRGWLSLPDLEDVRDVPGIAAVEGWQGGGYTVTEGDHPARIQAARVTGGLLQVFGLAPVEGRDLRREENDPGAARVVVISHGFRQEWLGGEPEVVGRTLELSGEAYEIVGVAPPGFDYPEGSMLWTPYRHPLEGCPRGCEVYQAVGRLAAGADPEVVGQRLTALASGLAERHPGTNTEKAFRTESLLDVQVGDVRTGLWALLGAVAMVLLIACANVANLLLARAESRRGEVAVRSALGASRRRMTAQLLTESAVLAAAGGVLGVLLSTGLVRWIRTVAPPGLPRIEGVSIDGTAMLFALGLTLVVSVVFGLSPALHLSRSDGAALTGEARSGTRVRRRARSWLTAIEVALSVILLIGSGLLMRTLGELYRVDMGFDARDVLRFSVSLPPSRYPGLTEIHGFYLELEERIAALPGVRSVGSSFGAPLTGANVGGWVQLDGGQDQEPASRPYASVRPVTPGFFETLGLDLLRGRGIERSDGATGPPVAVVNERFAAENFPGIPLEDVLGERVGVGAGFGFETPDFWTVVGVVGDVRSSLRSDPRAALYVPHERFGPGYLTVHLAGSGGTDVAGLLPAVREEVRGLDARLPVTDAGTVRDAIRHDAADTSFYLLVVGIFAALAVFLAAVGLYGVVAYLVSRRTREIGVRMALGAHRPTITRMVVVEGMIPVAVGLAVGLAMAMGGARVLGALLHGVEPMDPMVIGGVSVLVVAISAAAILVPARKASRVAPTEALRAEA